jgi:hypothetical protein
MLDHVTAAAAAATAAAAPKPPLLFHLLTFPVKLEWFYGVQSILLEF